jgi:hypothetical protein
MAKFFFDIREGQRFIVDEEGLEFPDVAAAEYEAATAAAEIGRDLLPKGDLRSVMVEVRNQHGQRVATATATLHVERVHPEPELPSASASV